MWQHLPLSVKQTLLLLGLQISALALGLTGFAHWMDEKTKSDLARSIDVQFDAYEALIQPDSGSLNFNPSVELRKELDADKDRFFLILDKDRQVVFESHGPSNVVRQALFESFKKLEPKDESSSFIDISNESWLVQSEEISEAIPGKPTRALAYLALNAEIPLAASHRIKSYMFAGGVLTLIVTTLGSAILLSFSTRNLTRFANQLSELQPPIFKVEKSPIPASREEKVLFESFRTMIARLTRSSQAERIFIANASHELKTPIAAALLALEVMLSRERTEAEYKETSEEVLNELHVLKRLSDALLDLAKLDEIKLTPLDYKYCDLRLVVIRVLERWRKISESKGMTLSCKTELESNYNVVGTLEQWEVILGNLVDNAIKYGKTGGAVYLFAQAFQNKDLIIEIRDNGIGMSSKTVARLGEAFYRADDTHSDGFSRGLGFAHAQRLIQSFSGEIKVTSELNTGTTIRLTLPLRSNLTV